MEIQEKQNIHEKVQRAVVDHCGYSNHGVCLYYARFGLKILRGVGIEACLQAGSTFWCRDPCDPFNGDFGYEWSPMSGVSVEAALAGNLPEIHIWLAVMETQEVIDFSSGLFPVQAVDRLRVGWPGVKPPPFLWVPVAELPREATYIPILPATLYAARLLCLLELQNDCED